MDRVESKVGKSYKKNSILFEEENVEEVKSEKELMYEKGEQLFDDILSKVHHGNINEMASYFRKNCENFDSYGYTDEKRCKNYCRYKYRVVLRLYQVV